MKKFLLKSLVFCVVIFLLFSYYLCMKLHKYIFSNLFVLLFYILVFLTIHVFILENLNIKFYPNIYITLEQYSSLHILLTLVALIFFGLFIIETLIRKRFSIYLPKIYFSNKTLKLVYRTLFLIGFIGNFFNFIILLTIYYIIY